MGDHHSREETESADEIETGTEAVTETEIETEAADPLVVWTVATFDLVALSLVILLAGHLSGVLAGALAGLGTAPGLAAFGYLWALVLVAVRWVLADGGITGRDRIRSLLVRGSVGGAGVGVGVVGGGVLVGGAVAVVRDPEFLATVAFVALFGTVVGAVVGAIVGAVSALCNVAVVRASERIVPGAGRDYSSSSS